MRTLEGKVALVSGAGRGIGRAIGMKLAQEGARVVLNDLDAEPVQETIELIRQSGGEAVACVGSVTERVVRHSDEPVLVLHGSNHVTIF